MSKSGTEVTVPSISNHLFLLVPMLTFLTKSSLLQIYVVFNLTYMSSEGGFPGGSAVKNLPAHAGDTGDAGYIPGSGRSHTPRSR